MNCIARASLSLILVVLLAACGGSGGSSAAAGSSAGASQAASAITDIKNISQLRDAFNQQAGKPRLIMLMSPT
jgi:hypothetical protein